MSTTWELKDGKLVIITAGENIILRLEIISGGFNLNWIQFSLINSTAISDYNMIPLQFKLNQNYPNPFNPKTKISYTIPTPGKVILKIYDLLGQEIETLVNKYQKAGSFQVTFKAENYSSGIYLYKLQLGNDISKIKKMLLIH